MRISELFADTAGAFAKLVVTARRSIGRIDTRCASPKNYDYHYLRPERRKRMIPIHAICAKSAAEFGALFTIRARNTFMSWKAASRCSPNSMIRSLGVGSPFISTAQGHAYAMDGGSHGSRRVPSRREPDGVVDVLHGDVIPTPAQTTGSPAPRRQVGPSSAGGGR